MPNLTGVRAMPLRSTGLVALNSANYCGVIESLRRVDSADLDRIEFKGLERVKEPEALEKSGLAAGQTVSLDDVEAASNRLLESGLFTNLSYKLKGTTLDLKDKASGAVTTWKDLTIKDGKISSSPGPQARIRRIVHRRYLVAAYALATAAAKPAASWFPTKIPSAVSISELRALLATTPWVSEPAILVAGSCQSLSALAR